ncbi:unnamed protein product [Effrenium voratum]|uniref:Uncharacterized protein n=1 Tax=Effrenium voratum TaxID=2562239 RepID=A0AA36JHN4_9DINO|nr:unnamed protein product [Effrenium voratum]CAJ1416199.1 unnamed protein product [Effrenium voratum]
MPFSSQASTFDAFNFTASTQCRTLKSHGQAFASALTYNHTAPMLRSVTPDRSADLQSQQEALQKQHVWPCKPSAFPKCCPVKQGNVVLLQEHFDQVASMQASPLARRALSGRPGFRGNSDRVSK